MGSVRIERGLGVAIGAFRTALAPGDPQQSWFNRLPKSSRPRLIAVSYLERVIQLSLAHTNKLFCSHGRRWVEHIEIGGVNGSHDGTFVRVEHFFVSTVGRIRAKNSTVSNPLGSWQAGEGQVAVVLKRALAGEVEMIRVSGRNFRWLQWYARQFTRL